MTPATAKYTFEAIGTWWSIETDAPLNDDEKRSIHAAIADFDATYSRFRNDSLVMRARGGGTFTFPSSIATLYDTYAALETCTDGAVNPLVGESLEQLGYDATYTLTQKGSTHIPPSFTRTVRLNANTLTFTKPALLDIGAIGKGYLVDILADIVARSHPTYVIDGSGDIAVHTKTPDTIGLENPLDPTRVLGVVRLHNKSLCASATNRRAWGDGLHHIIDARTGKPTTTDIIATWAIADTTMLADALATGLFFTPPETLQQAFGSFNYVTIKKDGTVTHNIQQIGDMYV
jgi:thiamine biosynthesis lipoprotein